MNRLLEVDTRQGTTAFRTCTEEEMGWGGRSFIIHHLLAEVDPGCDPLGHRNRLIIAHGLLGDSPLTTAGRYSIGGKSPLTGGVKEANVGGSFGRPLGRIGLKGIILKDTPAKPTPRILLVRRESAELIDAPELAGMETSATIARLRERFGARTGVIAIGPAGEQTLAAACIGTTDNTGVQLRVAGRGGLGAVMGSKGVKGIVVDDEGARAPEMIDQDGFMKAAREASRILREDPKTENRHDYGTPAVLSLCNELGILPTRNYSSGRFERADDISGEMVAELIVQRGKEGEAKRGLPCVQGCVIACSNIFADPSGKTTVASLQYENIALLGSNCGIGDIDQIAEMNRLCNEVGIDAIDGGAAIGVAMEAGVIEFGDAEGAKDLLRQVGAGTPLGKIIGSGLVTTARVLGVRRVAATKGQAMPAYDPRSLKGIGVTYAMSAMGADHTAGNALETAKRINPRGTEGQVESSYRLQVRGAILDSFGVCLFFRPVFVANPSLAAELLNGRYGWEWTYEDVQRMGIECLHAERRFNEAAGITAHHCDIPEFMRREPLPPHNTVFDIPREEMNRIWETKLPTDAF